MAKKLEAIKAKPRITYDETTSEFRKLDEEVNTLSSELSAARDAHEIIQEELSARQQALDESRATFREQDSALIDLKDQKASEEILVAVRKFRLARQRAIDDAEEESLAKDIEDSDAKLEALDQEVISLETAAAAAAAAYASAVVVSEGLQSRQDAASASIKRDEQRYAEVEASKDGLGALKLQVESDHRERVADKAPEAALMREDAAALKKETDDMVKPIKIAQMASDSLATLRKRVQAAKDRKAALDKEAQDLPKEIDSLEKEVEQMEKDAAPEPSCCVVM
jgi:FtsZ-binding cell division protein ZapB